jgi:hypothetical protein
MTDMLVAMNILIIIITVTLTAMRKCMRMFMATSI